MRAELRGFPKSSTACFSTLESPDVMCFYVGCKEIINRPAAVSFCLFVCLCVFVCVILFKHKCFLDCLITPVHICVQPGVLYGRCGAASSGWIVVASPHLDTDLCSSKEAGRNQL